MDMGVVWEGMIEKLRSCKRAHWLERERFYVEKHIFITCRGLARTQDRSVSLSLNIVSIGPVCLMHTLRSSQCC